MNDISAEERDIISSVNSWLLSLEEKGKVISDFNSDIDIPVSELVAVEGDKLVMIVRSIRKFVKQILNNLKALVRSSINRVKSNVIPSDDLAKALRKDKRDIDYKNLDEFTKYYISDNLATFIYAAVVSDMGLDIYAKANAVSGDYVKKILNDFSVANVDNLIYDNIDYYFISGKENNLKLLDVTNFKTIFINTNSVSKDKLPENPVKYTMVFSRSDMIKYINVVESMIKALTQELLELKPEEYSERGLIEKKREIGLKISAYTQSISSMFRYSLVIGKFINKASQK